MLFSLFLDFWDTLGFIYYTFSHQQLDLFKFRGPLPKKKSKDYRNPLSILFENITKRLFQMNFILFPNFGASCI